MKIVALVSAILLFVYPVFVYFGLSHFDGRIIALVLVALLAVRALFMPSHYRKRVFGMLLIGIAIAFMVFLLRDDFYLRLYPVLVSLVFLGVFTHSLYQPPSIIETFAKIYEFKDRDIPPYVAAYTRNVTKIWCGFFIVNAIIATYSLFQSLEFWAIYNGFISYILMGCLFTGEFTYRHLVIKKKGQGNA